MPPIDQERMTPMRLYIADAFTTQKFSGNQAGVALLDAGEGMPAADFMQSLAAELKHSETAFVLREEKTAFRIRYFTPEGEVDLCGHATIAAFTTLRDMDGLAPGVYTARTLAGDLNIEVSEDAVWMDMAAPVEARTFTVEEAAQLYAAYGLTVDAMPEGLLPKAVSTGLCDILLPVKSRELLNAAVQNETAVTELSKHCNVVGVHMFCPVLTADTTAHCRNFAPLYAIPEEAATGTSNGALTYYLYRYGAIHSGEMNRFLQGEKMGKPSEILSRLEADGDPVKVRVGGRAVLAMKLDLL